MKNNNKVIVIRLAVRSLLQIAFCCNYERSDFDYYTAADGAKTEQLCS